jgi:hypothetical protein
MLKQRESADGARYSANISPPHENENSHEKLHMAFPVRRAGDGDIRRSAVTVFPRAATATLLIFTSVFVASAARRRKKRGTARILHADADMRVRVSIALFPHKGADTSNGEDRATDEQASE